MLQTFSKGAEVVDDIGAMLQGLSAGKAAANRIPLSGIAPSAGMPRGAAPPVLPPALAVQFRNAISALQTLSQSLKGDPAHLDLDFQEMATEVQRKMVDKQKRLQGAAEQGGGNPARGQFPNIDAGGVV